MTDRNPASLVVDGPGDFRVHRTAYTDPTIFDLEMERIYGRSWIYLAHESELPDAGDFRATNIGTQPVLVTRGEDGAIHALFNRCRHRGSVVCREERGHANAFRCPYHGWLYRNDGALLNCPQADGYGADFDRSQLGLVPIPRLGCYRGLIFGSLDPDGETLEERLRDVAKYIDLWNDHSPIGQVCLTMGLHRYAYPGNWKLQMDNGVDGYHGNYVHESFLKLIERSGENTVDEFTELRRTGYVRGLSHGDGLIDRPYGGMAGQFDYHDPSLVNYHEQLEASYGKERTAHILGQKNLLIFPNLFLFESHLRVIRPISHEQTTVDMHPFNLVGVTPAINQARLRSHERFFGPAGFGAPDDVEMFVNVWSGLKARSVEWLLMSRGLNRETRTHDGELVGASSDEQPQRSAYREWRRLMSHSAVTPSTA